MPSSMTHTYFSNDVYNTLPPTCQKKVIKTSYYYLAAQGADPLMFYNFFIGPKSNYYKNLQHLIHTTNTRDYFLNLINYIHKNKLEKNKQVMSYLYGNICHYYLNLNTHPLIFYKTGLFQKGKKDTYKYNSLHALMEYTIDCYYIDKNENISPQKFPIWKHIFTYKPFSKELTDTINYVFDKTYNIKNITRHYIKSIKDMQLFFKYINYDKYGLKLKVYKLINHLTPASTPNLSVLSYANNYKKNLNYLNLSNKTWNHPTNYQEKYKSSFNELYQKAKKEASQAIIDVTTMLDNKHLNQTKLKLIFQNISYTTGKDCTLEEKFKYFEF